MTLSKKLDKYYTRDAIARHCIEVFSEYHDSNTLLIEPSAGGGAFLRNYSGAIRGFDILPEGPNIIQHDFLQDDLFSHVDKSTKLAFIGNPPFGKRANIAISFINKAMEMSGLLGFILPYQFRKWSAQSKIDPTARLIYDEDLPEDSFEFEGKPYSLRCSFQIWSRNHFDYPDLRLLSAPPTRHDDFDMWQFNRTEEARKYFDYDWDFAVPRQGFYDYTFKSFRKEDCDQKKQWIFFKAKNPEVLNRLLKIDFDKLSKLNSGIPGFGKADVVKEYINDC